MAVMEFNSKTHLSSREGKKPPQPQVSPKKFSALFIMKTIYMGKERDNIE